MIFIIVPTNFAYSQSANEMAMLTMFYTEADLVTTPTRSPKLITETAENISVVSSDQIEQMHYRTLPEALTNVAGLHVDVRNPWVSLVYIQGNIQERSTLRLDGISMNLISSNAADFGMLPVKNLSSIEAVKGPASSAWGSALGGTINLITKPAGTASESSNSVSASFGQKRTRHYTAETQGHTGKTGYYLYAGHLKSEGFKTNTEIDKTTAYGKIRHELSRSTNIELTLGILRADKGQGEAPLTLAPGLAFTFVFKDDSEYILSTLTLNHEITNDTEVSLSLRGIRKDFQQITDLKSGGEYRNLVEQDRELGGSAIFRTKKGNHRITAGLDYDRKKIKNYNDEIRNSMLLSVLSDRTGTINSTLRNLAVYANDTISIDDLTVTPGIRYDDLNIGGDFVSPSLGATYNIADNTIVRAYVTRGFNAPTLLQTQGIGLTVTTNPDLKPERVVSYHLGVETAEIPNILIKATAFRHDIKDAIVLNSKSKYVNLNKQKREGVEVELKTLPIYNTAFTLGGSYTDAKDKTTGTQVIEYGEYTIDGGIVYTRNSIVAAVQGHYIWWIAGPDLGSRHDDMIVDASISKQVTLQDGLILELFGTLHNIFDGEQYLDSRFQNPDRWAEAGGRLLF